MGEHGASRERNTERMIGDRLTRGMAARFLWGGLVLLCLIGLFVARSQKTTALNTQIQEAQDRASHYANTTVADAAIVDTRADKITFDKKGFEIATEGDVFTDPTVVRLRVWDKDGLLLASTDPSEAVGELVAADPLLTNALAGTTAAQVVEDDFTYSTVGAPRTQTNLLESFTPFRVKDQVQPVGAVQVDFLYGQLQAAASSPWDKVSRAFLFFAVVFALLFVLSLVRRPLTPEQRVIAQAPQPAEAPARVSRPKDDVQNAALEEELQVAREQLKQASEAFAFLEAKMKDGTAQASSVDVDAAMARITELEAALQRAEHDAEEARTVSVSQDDLEQVRRDADERVAELERQMKEEAAKPDPEIEALRSKLADAERRAQTAEASLASARSDVAAARQEVEAVAPEAMPMGLIEELEAKVAKAEARAKEAEEEALRITPEANDLRAKLAQAAARKKLGSSS
jgi:hypothetical protein